ncbi:amidohydrolase [Microdochium trichocladiopsis]|uniref:Amidohydrolase n=1 Tax=Microdochium trichocladiopsis TaxID=1682393 RepID=A0A9P9BPK9_9PEZI|nr:amidohydrolase [Microdochium trichocladiopsis]KAH7029364.1 amidohydrolase [Microdochium trichocladiopsis]
MSLLANVILPAAAGRAAQAPCDVVLTPTHEKTIAQSAHPEPPSLLLPALCHPHVHLDKPYILTCNHRPGPSSQHPDYSDLHPKSGAFDEALANTTRAKQRYTEADLYLRGSQLLANSYSHGVSSLRAFVEIDHVTGTAPLAAAIRLKHEFSHLLHLQICVFAQDPLFSTEHGEQNRSIIASVLGDFAGSVDALGTTPYVEDSREASLRNIEWAVRTSIKHQVHLDFHLDYNLKPPNSPNDQPLVYSVVDLLQKHDWITCAKPSMTIVLGHCTQLTVLQSEFQQLAKRIIDSGLPIHFVGLPTSDLFMMGRPGAQGTTHARPRGTLQVPAMIKELGLSACLGINNVGNAFTPYGNADPLQLASWGVGIYQAGTSEDAELLYGCVSWRARQAIGLDRGPDASFSLSTGQRWQTMLLVKNLSTYSLPGALDQATLQVPARQRLAIKDVVWDPPDTQLRMLV